MAEKVSFQQSMNRLEDIVTQLEKNELELEDAIHLFEEGLQLVNQCDQQLKGFEEKVNSLMNGEEAGEQNG